MSGQDAAALMEKLRAFGDAHKTWDWAKKGPDYVAQVGLDAADIPALIEIARHWTDDQPAEEKDVNWAPVHAWRALGQLRAVPAVAPLLDLTVQLDLVDDDWCLDEMPQVLGLIGPAALPALTAFLGESKKPLFPKMAVAEGLAQIALFHPDSRDEVIAILNRLLAGFEEQDETLNGALIGALLDLKAVESAELIERAYAAFRVDETINGEWRHVRAELGVKGLGLVEEAEAKAEDRQFDEKGAEASFEAESSFHPHPENPVAHKKIKSKKKDQRKARKRNRK